MMIAARVHRALAEPRDESDQLFDGFLVRFATLLGTGEFGIPEHPGFGITAGPGDDCGGTSGKKIDPIERTLLLVKADGPTLNLVLPNIVTIQVKVKRGFEFAGVGATAGKFALTPAREKGLIHR